jgi:hypothetical protein
VIATKLSKVLPILRKPSSQDLGRGEALYIMREMRIAFLLCNRNNLKSISHMTLLTYANQNFNVNPLSSLSRRSHTTTTSTETRERESSQLEQWPLYYTSLAFPPLPRKCLAEDFEICSAPLTSDSFTSASQPSEPPSHHPLSRRPMYTIDALVSFFCITITSKSNFPCLKCL